MFRRRISFLPTIRVPDFQATAAPCKYEFRTLRQEAPTMNRRNWIGFLVFAPPELAGVACGPNVIGSDYISSILNGLQRTILYKRVGTS